MLNKNVEKNIRIMFPENAEDRTQRILKRLRDDKSKDHHVPGSLTWIGRCAVDHAAANLIEQLESRVPRWISVEERLPKVDIDVLVCATGDFGSVVTMTSYSDHLHGFNIKGWVSPWQYFHQNYTITHWMTLPEPPKEAAP